MKKKYISLLLIGLFLFTNPSQSLGKELQDDLKELKNKLTTLLQSLVKLQPSKPPEKKDIKNNQNYKFLQSALNELKNISNIKDLRLNQLLTAYNDLESDIKNDEFKETAMPSDIADIKQQIENELKKRKETKTPPPVTNDPSTMNDADFEKWEEKLYDNVNTYRKEEITKIDLPILKDLRARVTAWQKDNRKEGAYEVGFGRFLRIIDEEIKDREKKITPEQQLKKRAEEIKKVINIYDPVIYQKWKSQEKRISRGKDIHGNPVYIEINEWPNKLVNLLNEIYIYYNEIKKLNATAVPEIQSFTENKLLPGLDTILTKEQYQKVLADPRLESRLLYNDKDALKERKGWIKYLLDYKVVSNNLKRSIPQDIETLYQLIVKNILGIYKNRFTSFEEQLKQGSLNQESDLTNALRQIDAYENFIKTVNQSDELNINPLKNALQKKLLEKKKSYFYEKINKIQTKDDFKKYTIKSLMRLDNQIDVYVNLVKSMNQTVEFDIIQFHKELKEYLKQLA